MLNNGLLLLIVSVSSLLSVFLVISIPKYLYMIEYATTTMLLNKIENIVSIFSAICFVSGFFIICLR